MMDKVTRQCPQTTTFLKRKESRSGIEPRSFRYEEGELCPPRFSLNAYHNLFLVFGPGLEHPWMINYFKQYGSLSVSVSLNLIPEHWAIKHKMHVFCESLPPSELICNAFCEMTSKRGHLNMQSQVFISSKSYLVLCCCCCWWKLKKS